jgi:hypothetical protein
MVKEVVGLVDFSNKINVAMWMVNEAFVSTDYRNTAILLMLMVS